MDRRWKRRRFHPSATSLRWIKPVRAFVFVRAGHHPGTERTRHCLAARFRLHRVIMSRRAPTCGLSPTAAVDSRTDQVDARVYQSGTPSRSQVSSRLRRVGHVASGCNARAVPDVPCSRTVIVSAGPNPAISEDRRGKRPLSHRCRLFAVRHRLPQRLTGKPSRASHG